MEDFVKETMRKPVVKENSEESTTEIKTEENGLEN